MCPLTVNTIGRGVGIERAHFWVWSLKTLTHTLRSFRISAVEMHHSLSHIFKNKQLMQLIKKK